MNILVIDDNKAITDALLALLKHRNYDVTIENNAKDGLKLIKSQTFDIVLLDLAMPEFSGIDVLQDLKENNLISKNNIVILTASAVPDEEIQGFRNIGVKQFLKKPIRSQELFENLEEITVQV